MCIHCFTIIIAQITILIFVYVPSNVPGYVSKEMWDSSLVMGTGGKDGEKYPASIVELLPDKCYTTVGRQGAKVLYSQCPDGILVVRSGNRMLSAHIEHEGQGLLLDKLDPTTETALWRKTGNGGHGNTKVPTGPFCVMFAFTVHNEHEDDRIPSSDGEKNKFSRTLPLRNAIFASDLPKNLVYVPRSELGTTSTTTTSNKRKKSDLHNWFGTPTTTAGTPRTSSATVRMVTPDDNADDDVKKTSAPCVLFDEELPKKEE